MSIHPKDENLDLRYEVLNQLIANDSISFKKNNYIFISTLKTVSFNENGDSNEPRPLGSVLTYDTIFSRKDSVYYKNQEKIISDFRLDKAKIHEKLRYVTDEELNTLEENRKSDFWTEFHKKFGYICIRSFSVPFLIKIKQCVLFKVQLLVVI
ncbi:hypothetical protein ACQWU4_11495 [Chryseobacterium sp. MIQD13]|uniref:hypothetical protein n=1 Tax=Chryseobacterium sp. MIQD13 TaxID=3422310 RepID=UPI003D296380